MAVYSFGYSMVSQIVVTLCTLRSQDDGRNTEVVIILYATAAAPVHVNL